jgi:anti-sigma regulatory factor (Ser/Thr protein kinase)
VSGCRVWSHDIKLLAELRSPSRARYFVRSRLAAHDLPLHMDDVELVVSELATNAVLHARTPFTVALHGCERTVLLEVEDGSPLGPLPVDAQVIDVSGRGMAIVDLLSHGWGVDQRTTAGKSVWAEFDR